MAKTPAKTVVVTETPVSKTDDPVIYDTDECCLCGACPINTEEDAYVMLRGMYMRSTEHEVPVFVLDPDTKVRIIQLANGQMALITDAYGTGPTKHAQVECVHSLIQQMGGLNPDPDPDDMSEEDADFLLRYR